MKKITLILVLAVIALVSGCMETSVPDDSIVDTGDDLIGDGGNDVGITPPPKTVADEEILVDKFKYFVGGREGFDTAKIFFTQKAGKGFEVTLDAEGKQTKVEVMTDKDCLKLDDEQEYEIIGSDEGTAPKVTNYDSAEENRNICINIEAIDEGEISAKVVVKELSF